jgi:hypothetical protein
VNNMETIIWTIGWAVAIDLCDYLTVKREVLQGKEPLGISKDGKNFAGWIWVIGILLTILL